MKNIPDEKLSINHSIQQPYLYIYDCAFGCGVFLNLFFNLITLSFWSAKIFTIYQLVSLNFCFVGQPTNPQWTSSLNVYTLRKISTHRIYLIPCNIIIYKIFDQFPSSSYDKTEGAPNRDLNLAFLSLEFNFLFSWNLRLFCASFSKERIASSVMFIILL